MRTFDLAPLHRFAIGFDNVSRLLDAASRVDEQATAYPPYNIEKVSENDYRITMAVAGFAPETLDVTVHDSTLVISGRQERATEEANRYLHRGIATRAFERKFELADHIKVRGASIENGLLHVSLERVVPEEKKPRKIEIASTTGATALEHQTEDAQPSEQVAAA
ncbi:Hsp20 family protein [Roseospira marina]|uniref:Hsp20 family protein n=1 Tax=Roseospira marina TaxID=140057 RepID=A0A5M6I9H0_9PROT|nr:Hsp20 family protein [Roseospira marina]KAA5604936.1 Hsp20 family protein [Roseospira marina]